MIRLASLALVSGLALVAGIHGFPAGMDAAFGPAPAGPPPQAVAAGFSRLDFSDEFNYPDSSFVAFNGAAGQKWNGGPWFNPQASKPADFILSKSFLTIRHDMISTLHNAPPWDAHTFLGGYFEARLYCTGWCGFYLGSYAWSSGVAKACHGVNHCPALYAVGKQNDQQYGGTAELDIIEARFSQPNSGYFTVHKNGMGVGDPHNNYGALDEFNKSNFRRDFNFPIINAWHTYGFLWTQKTLTWYLDNQPVVTTKAYRSSWQPCFMILVDTPDQREAPGSNDPTELGVDWVRVWEPETK
jgi:Glycosyl hydrolases family 16